VSSLEREPDLKYLTLSDYIQHKYAPGSKDANDFYVAIDGYVGRLAALGAVVALTGDHGISGNARSAGTTKARKHEGHEEFFSKSLTICREVAR
jgi:phosphonoacetate hydrolase